jgi:hypothetical protein
MKRTTIGVWVVSDWQIANRRFYRERIWTPARRLHPEIGSYAGWLKVLELVDELDGQLYFNDERPWRHAEVGDLFPDDATKWIANFLAADASGDAPRAYSPMFDRVRCIELATRINLDLE